MDAIQATFLNRLFVVYVSLPSLDELQLRLNKDGWDFDGRRYKVTEGELTRYWNGEYDLFCDLKVVSHEGTVKEVAQRIRFLSCRCKMRDFLNI